MTSTISLNPFNYLKEESIRGHQMGEEDVDLYSPYDIPRKIELSESESGDVEIFLSYLGEDDFDAKKNVKKSGLSKIFNRYVEPSEHKKHVIKLKGLNSVNLQDVHNKIIETIKENTYQENTTTLVIIEKILRFYIENTNQKIDEDGP